MNKRYYASTQQQQQQKKEKNVCESLKVNIVAGDIRNAIHICKISYHFI